MTSPDIPVDTILTLEPADLYPRGGTEKLTVQVLRIYPAGEGVAWVQGHLPECAHQDSDCVQPWCVEVIASVAALERASGRGRTEVGD